MSPEFGAAFTIDDKETKVFFIGMSYLDWFKYGGSEEIYTPAVYRYLLAKYITRVIIEDDTNDKNADYLISVENQLELKQLLDFMIDKAGFGDEGALEKLVNQFSEQGVSRKDNLYDLFLASHLDSGTYAQLGESDIKTRAQFIATLQHTTGITVTARFKDQIDFEIPLDLINTELVYFENVKTHLQAEGDREKINRWIRKNKGGQTESDTPTDEFDKTTSELAAAMVRDKKNPKKQYNWHADEKDFERNDMNEDSKILGTTNPALVEKNQQNINDSRGQ